MRAIPPAWLIGVHAIRLAGFLFLALLDMRLVSAWLVAPLAVLALGSGLLLALLTPWGILRYWWVAIKLAITAILTGVVLSVLAPRLGALALAVSGPAPRELALAERIPLVVAPAVASTLLVVNVALAIFKPGWRTGLEHRQHQ